MRFLRALPILFLATLANAPVEWSHETQETQPPIERLRLKTALYFDCEVRSEREPPKPFRLEVSYLVYAEQVRTSDQVNFKDSSRVLFPSTGWAPKDEFLLARRTTDGRLFVWKGSRKEGASPAVEIIVQITPVPGEIARSTLSLVRFTDEDSNVATAEDFNGNCITHTGRAAWEKYQGEEKD